MKSKLTTAWEKSHRGAPFLLNSPSCTTKLKFDFDVKHSCVSILLLFVVDL